MTHEALAVWIVNYQALAALVLLAAALAGLLIRQPARRAALDWATLIGLLALAGLSALPGWPRVALFERPAAIEPPAAASAPAIANAEDAPRALPRDIGPRFEPTLPPRAIERTAAPLPAAPVPPNLSTPPRPEPWRWSDFAGPLASAYLAGLALVAGWLLWGALESWRLVRRAAAPSRDLLAELAKLAKDAPPRLLVSRDVSAAAALGVLRPTILVTPQLAAAPPEVVRAVLAHELAHLRNGDLWFLVAGRAGLLLLFAQPLYYLLRRRAADAREALADASAAAQSDRTQYAELLVAAARLLSGPPKRATALAILERPSQLSRRVGMLLDPRHTIELRSSRRWRWLGAAAMGGVVLAASLVQVMPAAVGRAEEEAAQSDPVAAEESTHRRPKRVVEYTKERSASITGLSPRLPRMIAAPSKWSQFHFEDNATDPQGLPAAGARVRAADTADRAEGIESHVYRPVEPDAAGDLTYTGTVVDDTTGLPIAGATVSVKRHELDGADSQIIGKTESTTDDAGDFRFTLTKEQVANPELHLVIEAHHPEYVKEQFGAGHLSTLRALEQIGRAPDFARITLAPGDAISGQIVDPEGNAAVGVPIRYLTTSPEGAGSGKGKRLQSETKTDGEGRFRFSAVRGGLTRLSAEPTDYAPRTLLLGKRTGDLGRIQLEPGKRLTGTVVDVEGRPVANAWVFVSTKEWPFARKASGDSWRRMARSDAEGRFTVGPLRPGEYQVSVSDRYWADPFQEEQPPKQPPQPLNAVFLKQLVTVDDAPTPITLRAVPHVRLELQYVDAGGQPVEAGRIDFDYVSGKVGEVYMATYGHDLGRGKVSILAPKGLQDAVLNFAGAENGFVAYQRGRQGPVIRGQAIELGTLDHDVSDFFVLHQPSPTVVVQAVDPSGQPIPHFRPRIDYPAGTIGAHPNYRWESGIEGQVYLGLQPDGRWRSGRILPDQEFTLTVQADGYRPANKILKLAQGKLEEVQLKLEPAAPGEAVQPIVTAPAVDPREFLLVWDAGPMEEEAAEPARDARGVGAQPEGESGATLNEARLDPIAEVLTDETTEPTEKPSEKQGRRWLYVPSPLLPTGEDPEAGKPPRSIRRPEDLPPKGYQAYRRSDVPATRVIVSGRVTDSANQPVPGVLVDAWHWVEGHETTTDSQGYFEIRGSEPYDPAEVHIVKAGFSPQLLVGLKAGAHLDVTLDDRTAFEGIVRDPAGSPVAGALVRASFAPQDRQPLSYETTTDETGRYRLLVGPHNYDLWVRKPGVGVAQRPFAMAEQLDFQLEPGVKFEARLRNALTGEPVAGASFKTWRFPDIQGTSNEQGVLTIESLPAARIDFHIEAPGFARWWSPQTAFPADRLDPEKKGAWQRDYVALYFDLQPEMAAVDVDLEPAVTLSGRVLDPDGHPVAGATVQIVVIGSGVASGGTATTSTDGKFELNVPASGPVEYVLSARDGTIGTPRQWASGHGKPLRTQPRQSIDGLEIQLTRGATIRGQVLDLQGKPVAGREVEARAKHDRANALFNPTATTDAEGHFELQQVEGVPNYIIGGPAFWNLDDAPPDSWRLIEARPGQVNEPVVLRVGRDTPIVRGPFFRAVSQEEATVRAAQAFQPKELPFLDGQPRLIWDPTPTKAD